MNSILKKIVDDRLAKYCCKNVDYNKYTIRNDIRERMKKYGLTNRDMAQVIGCKPSTYSGKMCGFTVLTVKEDVLISKFFMDIEKEEARAERQLKAAQNSN